MNRRDAQQQLSELAQAVRDGKVLKSDDYPVLSIETRSGISLWELSATRAIAEGWSSTDAANWYEHEAIDMLVLDEE